MVFAVVRAPVDSSPLSPGVAVGSKSLAATPSHLVRFGLHIVPDVVQLTLWII